MKLGSISVFALLASFVIASYEKDQIIIKSDQKSVEPQFLIEFTNGGRQWVTEAQKMQLKMDGKFFMDITDHRDLGSVRSQKPMSVQFPGEVNLKAEITLLLKLLNKTNIRTHLEYFTTFHNRWFNSLYGEASSHWLLSTILNTIASAGAEKYGVTAEPFIHPWRQNSIVVTIPGKTNSTIIVGAHQDSANYAYPMDGRAPGADDDGSGTVTILEVLRVLLTSKDLLEGKAENTIEFHWYAGEEAGLLGSLALFADYQKNGRDVKAMLQQDMTGFYNATVEKQMEFGLMMDHADASLMEYIKLIIEEYTELPWVETACGGCGSDHMSAIRAGYPGAYVIEGDFPFTDKHLHGVDDLIEYLDYDHMIHHAHLVLGFLYELAFTKF